MQQLRATEVVVISNVTMHWWAQTLAQFQLCNRKNAVTTNTVRSRKREWRRCVYVVKSRLIICNQETFFSKPRLILLWQKFHTQLWYDLTIQAGVFHDRMDLSTYSAKDKLMMTKTLQGKDKRANKHKADCSIMKFKLLCSSSINILKLYNTKYSDALLWFLICYDCGCIDPIFTQVNININKNLHPVETFTVTHP